MSEKYIYTIGDYSVLWLPDGFTVVGSRNGAAYDCGCVWPDTADGCGIAISYASYQHTKQSSRDSAVFATHEGQRLFSMGRNKAHKLWLDS